MNKYSLSKTPQDILALTADRHRRLRKKKKFTQKALAERSDVSLGSLKRFEQNGQISFENLLKLAQILGQLDAFKHLFVTNDQTKEVEQLFSKKARGL